MSTSAGDCDILNGEGFLVRPDNSSLQIIKDAFWTSPSLTYCPPAPPPPEGPFCTAASLTYVIKATDVGSGLNFTTPLGNNFVKAGAAKTVFFMFAADANVPNSTDTASASPNKSVQIIAPCIAITKLCDNECTAYGQPIAFHGTVSNTGDTPLINVTVTDTPDQPGTVSTITFDKVQPSNRDWDGSLAAGESAVYHGTFTPDGTGTALCGPFTDTISATAVPSLDPLQRTISNTTPCLDPANGYARSGPRSAVTAKK
jgi:uncharacterized repeat protein (TIGR01451 family)